MQRTGSPLAITAALALAFQPSTAPAQWEGMIADVIGQTIANLSYGTNYCITGLAPPEKEIAEARDPAPATMQGYFDAARLGQPKSKWFKLNKKTKWQVGETSADMVTLDSQADPLAAQGNRLDPVPLRFYRSGDYQTALGQWAVLDGSGAVAGAYTAQFEREKKIWKLKELTLSRPGDTLVPAAQYCTRPGDVLTFRLNNSASWITGAKERLAKAENKLTEARQKATEAEARLAEKPRDSARLSLARDARAMAARRAKELEDRKKDLANAEETLAKAQKDEADLKALTGDARYALRLRVVPEETKPEAAPAAASTNST
jgi:hypothetical protein